ncbi:MAG: hypothetical protein WD648_01610 [Planctomycetaceae bacterium]
MLRGTVHGRTIELEQESGLPDGQMVNIAIHPVSPTQSDTLLPGEGLKRCFGAWADDGDELDRYLEWNREQRKIDRPEIEP